MHKVRDVLWIYGGTAMVATLYFLIRSAGYLTVGGGFATVSRDVLWMAPLSHLFFFAPFAALAAVVAVFVSREAAVRTALLILGALVIFGALMPWTQLTRLAALLLSIGLTVQIMRLLPPEADRLVALGRRWTLGMLACCFGLAAVVGVGRMWSHRRAVSALPAAPTGAPNVLLIILDTVRGSGLSLYGYSRETSPQIDAFAKGGTVFETAISAAPWTLPSHASMFTGHYPAWLSTDFERKLDRKEPTLAEVMSRAGYSTVGIAANMGYASWESGLARGFTEYHDYPVNIEQILRTSLYGSSTIADRWYRAKSNQEKLQLLAQARFDVMPKHAHYLMDAREVTDKFLSWRSQRDTKRPYFAFLNYFDAHDPYTPPDSLRRKFAKPPKQRDLYDAEIYFMDSQLGRLFRELESRGDLKNTVVIVTADHGEHFGERGLIRHANSVYTPLVHVPLVIRFDGTVPAEQRVERPVSLRDIGKTILELAGLQGKTNFPGTSLTRAWSTTPDSLSAPIALLSRVSEDDPSQPAGDSTMVAAFDDRWHLVRVTPRAMEEMFQYKRDTNETENLIGSDSAKLVAPVLRDLMKSAMLADRPMHRVPAAKGKK
ncbi:MAG: sulfatase [Gemmatimonadaceae bacterium]